MQSRSAQCMLVALLPIALANISGAVLAKYAPHKDNALKLMEFLASDDGQEMYADVNNEHRVKEGVRWSHLVKSWGSFKPELLRGTC